MAYESTGMMAMFPIYLQRMAAQDPAAEEINNAVAQNEVNLNQNLEELKRKILEIESFLAEQNTENNA